MTVDNLISWLPILFSGIAVVLLIIVLKRLGSAQNEASGAQLREEFRLSRGEAAEASRALREEVSGMQKSSSETIVKTISEMSKTQQQSMGLIEKQVRALTASNEERMERMRTTLTENLASLQQSNEKKLDQMRQTVDEKLQSTLEKRLGESFKLVSERLEAVQRGLGEMQSLAAGVGDLKRVLTNVKARGTWGEFQLGDILEQILTPSQYDKNVQPKKGSSEVVEYAVRLPGDRDDSVVWLPIDSKFPQEDYQRLLEAEDIVDTDAVEKAKAALMRAIDKSAKDISLKYIDPPQTTDFAIMFLPTESLYSEVLRHPGAVEKMQNDYRVAIAGPTTLAALLNSLRMGFRTLAIEKRSSEVWSILAAVKTEFGKFGDVLSKVKKQLATASNTIGQTEVRTRSMERKLRSVEELPADESVKLLGLDAIDVDTEDLD